MNLRSRMLARIFSAGIVVGTVVAGPILLNGSASAGELTGGGSICGTVWHDSNEDGFRQANEPGIPYHLMSINGQHRYTISGPDGRYCLKGLPVGDYVVKSQDRARFDAQGWTIPRMTGSRFEWTTGLGYDNDGMNTFPVKIREQNGQYTHVEGFDSGFVTARIDSRAVQIVDMFGPVHKVGEIVEITGSVNNRGNTADYLGATLTLPEGLTIVQTIGMPSRVEGRQVIGDTADRPYPGFGSYVGVRARVDKVMTDAEIKLEVRGGVFADIDQGNNVLTAKTTAVE